MTIESEVAGLTTTAQNLFNAATTSKTAVDDAVALFAATTSRVDDELNNVDNTADLDKPVSDDTATALGLKQDTLVDGTNISTVNGVSLLSGTPLVIERSATSLSERAYEDRGVLRGLAPQVDDSVLVEGLGLFMFVSSQDEPDDDETCFTTASGQWLLSVPAFDLTDAMGMYEEAIRDELDEDENIRFEAYLTETGR
jgi:hypothetical protein